MSYIKYAFRQLVRQPGMSLVVIVMLALGIGATTAIFSVFHQLLLQPLPVPEPERLVAVTTPTPWARPGGGRTGIAVGEYDGVFSYRMFRDLEAGQTALTGLAAHHDFLANLTFGDETTGGRGVLVSGSYFDVLNLRPAAGRLIGPQDEPRIGESAVVVLSHDYWQARFGGDPDVVGEALTVNDRSLTIVGVAPEGFTGAMAGWQPHVFVPLTLRWLMQPEEPMNAENRAAYWVYLLGRLGPDVSREQAEAELGSLYNGIIRDVEAPAYPQATEAQRELFLSSSIALDPAAGGQSNFPERAGLPLTLLLGVTGLVVLIVCVNIANLLLARGASRAGELAIRASMGAGRSRLVSQLLVESSVLAAVGGLLSLPVAAVTLGVIETMIPQDLAARLGMGLNATAAAFAAGVTLATVLLFALAPALKAGDADPGRALKAQAARSSESRGLSRFRATLITVQVALSMVLLVLAGLFTQSLVNVARVDLGIDVDSVVSFSVSPMLSGYERDGLDVLYERIREEIAAQPGVVGVASGALPLMSDLSMGAGVSVVGEDEASGDGMVYSQIYPMISPGFFQMLSMQVLAGRGFEEPDRSGAPVAIVNESFARAFDLGRGAVGERVRTQFPYAPDTPVEIVGIVADAKYSSVKADIAPQLYLPRRVGDESFSSLFFVVRAGMSTDALMTMIPRAVEGIDPSLPVGNLTTLSRRIQENVYLDRLTTALSASLAGLATVLAAIGLYGALAYNVAQRTRELGLRQALGASPGTLRAMVLRQVGWIALIGGVIGLAVAVGVGRAAGALLFGLSGSDPFVLTAAVAVLAVVVLVASYVPARRASNVAPMEALRYE